jgi:hypothetical protein
LLLSLLNCLWMEKTKEYMLFSRAFVKKSKFQSEII